MLSSTLRLLDGGVKELLDGCLVFQAVERDVTIQHKSATLLIKVLLFWSVGDALGNNLRQVPIARIRRQA